MSKATKDRSLAVLGIAIMVLGVLTVVQGIQSRHQDAGQRACIADNFGKLTKTLTLRGDLADRDQKNRNRSDQSQTRLILRVFGAKDQAEALRIFAHFKATQKKVKAEAKDIAETRKHTKIPPFPPGTCNDGVIKPTKPKPSKTPTPDQSKDTS